jgi:hypothetical protein
VLKATVELLSELFLLALSLMITLSVVVSIVTALRAVGEEELSSEERPRALTTATHHQHKLLENERKTCSDAEVFRRDTRV